MKKVLFLLSAVLLFACSKQEGFKIKVNLDGAEGKILLEERADGAWVSIDTADVVDGTAVLEGTVPYPGPYYLSIVGQRPKTILFVENAEMTVTGKADSLFNIQVSGSVTHDEFKAIDNKIKEVSERYMKIYQEARAAGAAGDTAKADSLMDEVEKLYESTITMQEDFVKEKTASYVTPYFLARIQYGKEAEELEEIVNALDPKIQEVKAIQEIKDRIEKLKRVAVGQIAPDFTQNDSEGNSIRFSDIYKKNELTLLDFWASWCGPCRGENPNVVAVYNEFKDKGFSVLGVSLDRDKAAWLKAIDDDRLTWDHVSDLAYWSNAAAQLYAVSSIPHSLLVDKTGKIIAKNKRGDDLRQAVAEYFREQ